jgi:hypothetical protein
MLSCAVTHIHPVLLPAAGSMRCMIIPIIHQNQTLSQKLACLSPSVELEAGVLWLCGANATSVVRDFPYKRRASPTPAITVRWGNSGQ